MAIDVSVVILPEHPWTEARPRWQEAEARGFAAPADARGVAHAEGSAGLPSLDDRSRVEA